MKLKNIYFLFFFLNGIFLFSQNEINYKADQIKFLKTYKGGAKRLLGNVQFTTSDGMRMTCDSSYFLDNNTLEAFSNIVIHQGDSLTITGKNAHYDGNTKLGIIEGNVICTERDMTLTTPTLTFDSKSRMASYVSGGTIVSKENTLTSKHGYYHSPTKTVSFRYDVKLVNPDYTMLADTLQYVTSTKTAVFKGPTNIISKQDKLYCEQGWYNTQTQNSHLTKNAIVYSGKNILYADSMHYDKKMQTGHAFSHVRMVDTVDKTIITGNRSYNNQKKGITWITNHTLLCKAMGKDTLFVTADTMWAYEKKSSRKDSSKLKAIDSSYIKAYHHVKIFKTDVQALADTMIYSSYDSMLTLTHLPIMWNKENQMSGKKILVYFRNNKIDKVQIPENTFIAQQIDTIHFSQIKGKVLWAYFKNDTLRRIDIVGNAQAAYYLKNDKNKLQGVNLIESSKLSVVNKTHQLDQIIFYKKPVAKVLPMKDLDPKKIELKGFTWQGNRRPKSKEDLFHVKN